MSAVKLVGRLGSALAELLLGALYLTALALSPLAIGRTLRTVSLPRFRERKLRTTLAVFGVALGVAVVVAVVLVNRSIMGGVRATVDNVSGKAALQVSGGLPGFDESLLERARAVPGVAKAVPTVQQTAVIADPRARGERLLLLGTDLLSDDDKAFRSYASAELSAIEKDPIAFLDSPSNIIVGRALADRLGLGLHDKLAVSTARGVEAFEVWGFIDGESLASAFGGAVAVMYYPSLQAAFERGSNIDRIDIALREGANSEQVAAALRATLGAAYAVEPPGHKGDRVGKMLKGVDIGLSLASMIALIVGMFLIYNTVSISIIQRRRELGTLRALGLKRGDLLRLLMLEAALLGAVGSALGVLLGLAMSRSLLAMTTQAVNKMFLQVAVSDVRIEPPLLLAAFLLGIVAASLAAAVPAFRAGRTPPVVTLRAAGASATPASLRLRAADVVGLLTLLSARALLELPALGPLHVGGFAASAALILGGALVLPRLVQLVHALLSRVASVLGLEVMLAVDNLPRDLGRTSTTAAALMVGVAMAASFGAFIEGFNRSLDGWAAQMFPGDLFITNADPISGVSFANVPMSDVLGADIQRLDGVDFVRRIRISQLEYGSSPIKLVSTDFDLFARRGKLDLLEGEQAPVLRALRSGAVAVSENFARHFGLHRGDEVTLSTKNGSHTFAIAGVVTDYTSDIGAILLDRATYIAQWGDSRVDTYEVHVKPAADVYAVRKALLARHGEAYNLFALTNGEFRAEIVGTMEQIFAITRSLELVAIVVAVLGVLNALLASVLDRVREIGVLRALGMQRGQARRIIMTEAALVGAIGVLAGVLVGIGLGYVMLNHINLAQTGWYFPYSPPWKTLLETAALVLPIATLAGYYPARAAASLRVTEALGYE
jgi:putative ABC transport system permease protein